MSFAPPAPSSTMIFFCFYKIQKYVFDFAILHDL